MKVGEQIRYLRKSKGISQADLAKQAGMFQPNLCQIELGRRDNMTITTLEKLGISLGFEIALTPIDYLDGVEEK